MTVSEAAIQLGISPGRVRSYIAEGRLPAERPHPKLLLLRPADVAAFAVNGRRPRGWRKGRPRTPRPEGDRDGS